MEQYRYIAEDVSAAEESLKNVKRGLYVQKRRLHHLLEHNVLLNAKLRQLEKDNKKLKTQLAVSRQEYIKLQEELIEQRQREYTSSSASQSDDDDHPPTKLRRLSKQNTHHGQQCKRN